MSNPNPFAAYQDPEPQEPAPATDDPFAAYGGNKVDVMITRPTPKAKAPEEVKVHDPRTALQVAKDQALNVVSGTPSAITGIPSALYESGVALKDMVTGKGSSKAQALVEGALRPFETVAKGAAAAVVPPADDRYLINQTGVGKKIRDNTPSQEDWEDAAKAAGGNAAGIAIGEFAPHVPAILKSLAEKAKGVDLRVTPATLATRGLNPSDINFQKHVDAGLAELRAGEAQLGRGAIKTVPIAQDVLKGRSKVNNGIIKRIVEPQATITVPGSGQAMTMEQIAAIPKDMQMQDAAGYAKLVEQIQNAHPGDYTIGELNDLRSELGSTQSAFYGRDLSGQLTMDAGKRAVDIARGSSSRRLFYHALDNYGLGGGEEAATVNSRIGAIIHMQDALQHALNTSIAERRPFLSRMRRSLQTTLGAEYKGVDENLAAAIRRSPKPSTVPLPLEDRVVGTVGKQHDLIPMDRDPNSLLQPPPRTSSGIGDTGFTAQQDALRAQRAAPPADVTGEQQPLNPFPGPLGQDTYGMGGTLLSPEEQYLQDLNRRKLWDKGLPKGQREIPVPKKGQMDMQKGLAPSVFGVSPAEGATVPPGSKLAFKSRMLDGTDQWHYEAPDGKIITLDHELSPAFTKDVPVAPKEPGTKQSAASTDKKPIKLLTAKEWQKKFGGLNPPPSR